MDYQTLAMILSPIMILVGYLHIRLNAAEKGAKMHVTESEVKDILNSKIELMSLQIQLLSSRMDRLEESLDRISDKLDALILR